MSVSEGRAANGDCGETGPEWWQGTGSRMSRPRVVSRHRLLNLKAVSKAWWWQANTTRHHCLLEGNKEQKQLMHRQREAGEMRG